MPSRTDPPLLLLHGFTGSTETWRDLRERLGERRKVVAIDLPGHGRADAPSDPSRYALDRVADDLADTLSSRGTDRVVALGYSMGGRVALRLALRHPGRVLGLVLESTSPGIADPVARAARLRADGELADRIERDGIVAFVNEWERLPIWASQASLPDSVRARLRAKRLMGNATGLANSLRGAGAGADAPVLDRLGEIAVPVLLVAGTLDQPYVAHARAMQNVLKRAQLSVVPGAGHAVHLEQPAAFASLVAGFLDSFAGDDAPSRGHRRDEPEETA